MKIEKINENSIVLTIDSDELKLRNLKLADLSYGSDKARDLLVELINKADTEVGFKADAPLAVEAVPLKEGNIKLIISKIINPDELDARFSRFTPNKKSAVPMSLIEALEASFDKLEESLKMSNVKGSEQVNSIDKLELRHEDEVMCIFEFESIDKASDACKNIHDYNFISILYKDEKNDKFYLVLTVQSNPTKDELIEFNKVCNALAEYGFRLQGKIGMTRAYYEEHYKVIIKKDAVKKLSLL